MQVGPLLRLLPFAPPPRSKSSLPAALPVVPILVFLLPKGSQGPGFRLKDGVARGEERVIVLPELLCAKPTAMRFEGPPKLPQRHLTNPALKVKSPTYQPFGSGNMYPKPKGSPQVSRALRPPSRALQCALWRTPGSALATRRSPTRWALAGPLEDTMSFRSSAKFKQELRGTYRPSASCAMPCGRCATATRIIKVCF